jgi:hypothetical protein
MNELPRQKLRELIAAYSRSLCDDPRRCEALLRDYCGAHKREINVLVSALRERVAADLLGSQGAVPPEVLFARLRKRLRDNLGLADDAASWAVESWAAALGVGSEPRPDRTVENKPRRERVRTPRKRNTILPVEPGPSAAEKSIPKKASESSSIRVTDRRVSSVMSSKGETYRSNRQER